MNQLYRSRTDRWFAGICGGIGKTYGIDPTLIRLIMVFVLIFTGCFPMGLFYLIAWAIIPEEPVV